MIKKILSFLILFFFYAAYAGGMSPAFMDKVAGPIVLSCSVDNDSEQWAPSSWSQNGSRNALWKAQKVTFAATTTITQYVIQGCNNNGGSGTIEAVLVDHKVTDANCTGGGDCPDEPSEISGSSVTINASNYPACASYSTADYTLASTYQVSAGTYWIITKTSNVEILYQGRDDSSSGNRYCTSPDSGVNWLCYPDAAFNDVVMGCSP